jgi:hypothetical protein
MLQLTPSMWVPTVAVPSRERENTDRKRKLTREVKPREAFFTVYVLLPRCEHRVHPLPFICILLRDSFAAPDDAASQFTV